MTTILQQFLTRSASDDTHKKIQIIGGGAFSKLKDRAGFDSWYEKICADLSKPQWSAVFDSTTLQPVTTTTPTNAVESSILYQKLKQSLEKDMQDAFLDTADTYVGHGLEFLQAIKQECQPALSSTKLMEAIADITCPKMKSGETIGNFPLRIRQLNKLLIDNGHHQPPSILRLGFLNALGPTFQELHKLLTAKTPLPEHLKQFNTEDLRELTIAARTYERQAQEQLLLYQNHPEEIG